jgi:hypothetical protein
MPPDDADHSRGHKFPFVANEAFSTENQQILECFFTAPVKEKALDKGSPSPQKVPSEEADDVYSGDNSKFHSFKGLPNNEDTVDEDQVQLEVFEDGEEEEGEDGNVAIDMGEELTFTPFGTSTAATTEGESKPEGRASVGAVHGRADRYHDDAQEEDEDDMAEVVEIEPKEPEKLASSPVQEKDPGFQLAEGVLLNFDEDKVEDTQTE